MLFPPGKRDQAIQLLVSAVGRTEAKPGCRECLVARDVSGEGLVRYSEVWDSESAFQQHLRSEEFRRVLVAMDMSYEEPKVVIGNLSGRNGFDYMRTLYGSKEKI
jgi:quinol monooxygenase YgiN